MAESRRFTPELLRELKIERFACILAYPPRDLQTRKEAIIDAVLGPVQQLVTRAGYTGTVKCEISEDDLSFSFESGRFHFQLDVKAELAGAQFKDLVNHQAAVDISKSLMRSVIDTLGLKRVSALVLDFRNIFDLSPDSKRRNIDLFRDRVSPVLGDRSAALGSLISDCKDVARIDFKVGWDIPPDLVGYFTLELPANEANSTVWPSLNIRSREESPPPAEAAAIDGQVDRAYGIYLGSYAETLSKLLGQDKVDLSKRSLLIKG